MIWFNWLYIYIYIYHLWVLIHLIGSSIYFLTLGGSCKDLDEEAAKATPPLRLRRKSKSTEKVDSQETLRMGSAETLKHGGSVDSLPTDPCIKRSTTVEQNEPPQSSRKNKEKVRPGSSTDKPKKSSPATSIAAEVEEPPRKRLRKAAPLESPVNVKALSAEAPTPAECTTDDKPKRSSKTLPVPLRSQTKAKAKPMPKSRKSPKKKASPKKRDVPTEKAAPKKKPKASPKKQQKASPKQPEAEEVPDEQEEEEDLEVPDEQEEKDQDPNDKKKQYAHRLYMRYWRNLRSPGLKICKPFFHHVLSTYYIKRFDDLMSCLINCFPGRKTPNEIKDLAKRFKYCWILRCLN